MLRPSLHPHPQTGFSLLELSVVLAIIAIITAGTFSMGSSVIESARRVNTNNKLDAIEEALLAFRLANNRLPCPGDATLTDIPANSTTYGYEAGANAANNPANSCTGGSPAANFSYTLPKPPSNSNIPGGTIVAEGAVPVKALGLPDEYQWDGWGRKFAYAVWTPLTATNAFIMYGLSPNCGGITVENAGHGYRTTAGAYALISFGSDGHGGYLESGRRYFLGTEDNADEKTNCHCNGTADTGYLATYVEQDSTQTNPNDSYSVFDDMVRFKDRWQMQNAYDTYVPNGASCAPGFRIDGEVASGLAGFTVATGDVNGDGIPDLIIGSRGSSGCGPVYVVFGTKNGFPNPLPLSSLNGTNGFTLTDSSGCLDGIVTAGDFDRDGYADIAAINILGGNLTVDVFYGGPESFNASYDFGSITACQGFTITGLGPHPAFTQDDSIAAGDVNGDGIDDLIVGNPRNNGGDGQVFVMLGQAGTKSCPGTGSFPSSVVGTSLSSSSTPKGSIINGPSVTYNFGGASSSAGHINNIAIGDVNGDGYGDVIIGDDSYNSNAGRLYVILGQASWPDTVAAGSLAGSGTAPYGFIINGGASPYNFLGSGDIAAGDVTGDRIADILVGNGNYAYLIPGRTNPWDASYTLSSMGALQFDYHNALYPGFGSAVATGDVNGDGVGDLIISDSNVSNPINGSIFVVYGGSSLAGRDFYSDPLTGSDGVLLDCPFIGGLASCGTSLTTPAALNGNGINDIILGTPNGSLSGDEEQGYVYVVFGRKNAWTSPYVLSNIY